MYKVEDYIIYGGNGVCKVEDICVPPEVGGVRNDQKYYILNPIYLKGNTIYTPVENTKVISRRIISKEETELLIKSIPSIGTLIVTDDKTTEVNCKNALRSCDCTEWVKVIKTIQGRNQVRLDSGKKIRQSEEHLLKAAKEFLYGELAIPLEISKDQVSEYILKKIGN